MNGFDLVRLQPNQVKKAGDTMTGHLTMTGAEVKGNATTATKLKDPVTLTIADIPKQFDGITPLTWTSRELGNMIGANFLPLAGGIMRGSILTNANNTLDLGSNANRWKSIYTNDVNASGGVEALNVTASNSLFSQNTITVKSALANNAGFVFKGTDWGAKGYYSEIRPTLNNIENANNYMAYEHQNNRFLFESQISPVSTEIHDLGAPGQKWNNLYLTHKTWAFGGRTGYEVNHLLHRGNTSPAVSLMALNEFQAEASTILVYNEGGHQYLSPKYSTNMGLGRNDELYRDVWCQNGVVQTSDINAKENIKLVNGDKPLAKSINSNNEVNETDLLDLIKGINVYSFDYININQKDKSAIKSPSATQLGIIAQEIKDLNSNAWKYIGVDGELQEDGTTSHLGIKQGSINGLLISVVKSLINKIEVLTGKISDLEAKNIALESRLNVIEGKSFDSRVIENDTDWDSLTKNGVYKSLESTTGTNRPSATTYDGTLMVFSSNGTIVQMYIPYGNNRNIRFRSKHDNQSWTVWRSSIAAN
jgi:hypothetical protein